MREYKCHICGLCIVSVFEEGM
ncbi:hypothetical protein L345_00315, partial [Ophiophagus hannah]